ncbi:hypothetical protein, partial [Kribbella italica]
MGAGTGPGDGDERDGADEYRARTAAAAFRGRRTAGADHRGRGPPRARTTAGADHRGRGPPRARTTAGAD